VSAEAAEVHHDDDSALVVDLVEHVFLLLYRPASGGFCVIASDTA